MMTGIAIETGITTAAVTRPTPQPAASGAIMFLGMNSGAMISSHIKDKAQFSAPEARPRRATASLYSWSFTARSRRALPITLTEDRAMARAATAGDNSHPNVG
ncbi:hypothetical protein BH10PSE3_BH10PSE3_12130 [soil metagenome]